VLPYISVRAALPRRLLAATVFPTISLPLFPPYRATEEKPFDRLRFRHIPATPVCGHATCAPAKPRAFLLRILEHCRRAAHQGRQDFRAISSSTPDMNCPLATDQPARSRRSRSHSILGSRPVCRAGLYIGAADESPTAAMDRHLASSPTRTALHSRAARHLLHQLQAARTNLSLIQPMFCRPLRAPQTIPLAGFGTSHPFALFLGGD